MDSGHFSSISGISLVRWWAAWKADFNKNTARTLYLFMLHPCTHDNDAGSYQMQLNIEHKTILCTMFKFDKWMRMQCADCDTVLYFIMLYWIYMQINFTSVPSSPGYIFLPWENDQIFLKQIINIAKLNWKNDIAV